MKLLGLALTFALAAGGTACKHDAPTTPTTPISDPKPAGGTAFTLVEMKLYLGNDLGLQIHKDGLIEENRSDPGQPPQWQPVAKISAEGKLFGPTGEVAGEMQPDGSFKFAKDGSMAPFKFEGAALVAGARRVSIDEQGVIQGGNDQGVKLRVEGITDDGSRRAALFALALALMSSGAGGGGEEEGGVEGGVEGGTPPS